MYGRDVTHREVASVTCPKCSSPAGMGCVTDTGWRARTHKVRIRRAEKMKADGSLRAIQN